MLNTIRHARRNDAGVGVIGLVVTLVILSIIAAIGGPPLWRLITDANEAKLNSHLEQAADAVRARFRLKPELLKPASTTSGAMTAALRDDLTAEWGVPWLDWPVKGGWAEAKLTAATGGAAQDQTFFLQAINTGGTAAPGYVGSPVTATGKTAAKDDAEAPKYPFIATPGGAWRIAVVNDDGAWACALIVQRPKVSAAEAIKPANYVLTLADTDGGGSHVADTPAFDGTAATSVSAWMVGEWYDRGERLLGGANNEGMNSVCSPVVAGDGAKVSLPVSVGAWPVGNSGGASSAPATWPDGTDGGGGGKKIGKNEAWRTLSDRL